MNKNIANPQIFNQPHFNSLIHVSPRIEYLNDKGEWELTGSGILFPAEDKFHVITAAHCIKDDSRPSEPLPSDRLRIVLCLDPEKVFSVNRIEAYYEENDLDFSLLEVDFNQRDNIGFDYENGIKLIGSDIDTLGIEVALLGHDKTHRNGQLLECKCKAHSSYRLTEGFKAGDVSLENLKGFSGGGIFIQKGSVIYCMAYAKEILNGSGRLDEIGIRHIPDLQMSNIWYPEMPSNLPESESFGNNKAQQDYYLAWNNLLNFLQDNKDDDEMYKNLLDEIEKTRSYYPRPKSINRQIKVERLLFERHRNFPGNNQPKKDENWSENDKRAFGLVMRDRGTWMDLYRHLPESLNDLKKKNYMVPIVQRAATITGDTDLEVIEPPTDQDAGIYEHIMRAAFSFDFKTMRNMVESWSPSPQWMLKRVMLKSLWDKPFSRNEEESILSSDLKNLKENIDSGVFIPEDKFIACIIYNVCKCVNPFEYDYREFNVAGLDSPSAVISHIAQNIDKVKSEPVPYGIHVTPLYGTIDTDSLPESLRILHYLLNAGLLPSTNFGNIVNIGIWMKVFRHLFILFPQTMLFYTLTYANENLIRLCAQEIAFFPDKDFDKVKTDIMLYIFKAIECEDTPPKFRNGLRVMAIELFPTVNEDIWADIFINSVEKALSEIPVEYLSVRDSLTTFIGDGISNIRNGSYKKKALNTLFKFFDRNPLIISHILSWSMEFDENLLEDTETANEIKKIINDYPLSKIYRFLQRLNFNKCLTKDLRTLVITKLDKEDFSFAKNDQDTLILLSNLLEDKDHIEKLKSTVLQSWDGNYWNCGFSGNTFSSKGHLHLELIDDRVYYDDKELMQIIVNMKDNIRTLKDAPESMVHSRHVSYLSAGLLIDMKRFLNKPNVKSRVDYDGLNNEIDELIKVMSNSDSILQMLSSDEFQDIKSGIELLAVLIDKDSFHKYKREIYALLYLATNKVKHGIELAMGFISHLVTEFTDEMKSEFEVELKLMLRNYLDFDYQELKVNALNLRKHIESINEKLRCQ